MRLRPKSELTIVFISITIMLAAFAGIGYIYLTSNQITLMEEFENQRILREDTFNAIQSNISETLQKHDNRISNEMGNLNITGTS